MSNTPTHTFAHENVAADPVRMEPTHFVRMAALYAWIAVTLAIFVIAATLAGVEDAQATPEPGSEQVQVVGDTQPTP